MMQAYYPNVTKIVCGCQILNDNTNSTLKNTRIMKRAEDLAARVAAPIYIHPNSSICVTYD